MHKGIHHSRLVLIGSAVLAFPLIMAAVGSGPTKSPIQSTANPDGITIYTPVYEAGTDTRSKTFQTTYLPGLTTIVTTVLSEGVKFNNAAAFQLSAQQLYLSANTTESIRVYFVDEDAAFSDQVGISNALAGQLFSTTNMKLIFPDASTNGSTRTTAAPLLPGDFVDLGNMNAGTQLDFFMVQNGANGGTLIWKNNPALNSDGKQHMVAWAIPNSSFLLIGFEDLTDFDYNDVTVAIDIGVGNVTALTQSGSTTALPN